MKKVLSFLTLGIVIITFYGCTSSTPSNSPQEPKWLLKEVEYGAKYPYSEDGLSLYCEDSAIWLETVEGFKYALNSSATELLKNEKNYKGKAGTILASGPLMLKDGQVCDWNSCEPNFIRTKHPRSAVATTKDGKVLLITVDGRFPEQAGGVNIPELAHLIRVLGGEDALNLDGGGSTTLWLSGASDNGVVNYPCDNGRFDHAGERKVPNILYITHQ